MKVAILMGSPRDDEKMAGDEMLERFGVQHEVHVVSATETQKKLGTSQVMLRIMALLKLFAALAWQPISLALCRLTPPCP